MLSMKSKGLCDHKKSHYEDWPDGGQIEVCDDCNKSRYHWEWGKSSWILVKDIPKARKDLQDFLDSL